MMRGSVDLRSGRDGFGLVEMLVVVAIGSFMALVFGGVLAWTAQNQAGAMSENRLETVKRTFVKMLRSRAAWQNTIVNGAAGGAKPAGTMDCLANRTECTTTGAAGDPRIQDQLFALYDPNNQLVYDATNLASGLTPRGEFCQTFSAPPAAGNNDCPFRYDLRWTANCSGSCVEPQVEVNAVLMYNPQPNSYQRLVFDPRRLSINKFYVEPLDCASQSWIATIPNNYNFVVPNYKSVLVVEAWGAGGGANGVSGPPGGNGGASTFNATLVAGGGAGGNANTWFFWVGQNFGLATGGVASGGMININGGDTPNLWGGDAPMSGMQTWLDPEYCDIKLIGGKGGAGAVNVLLGGPGMSGTPLGGGGAGSWAALGFWWLGAGWGFSGKGGGGGAYAATRFAPGGLPVGANIQVVVGAGGLGSPGATTTLVPGVWYGGNGANGAVVIRWR